MTLSSTHKPSSSPKGWLSQFVQEYQNDPDYVAEGLALEITEQAIHLMEEKGISRSELASIMGVTKAYVTRVLNAPPNLTLRSIAALAIALGTIPYASLESPRQGQQALHPHKAQHDTH